MTVLRHLWFLLLLTHLGFGGSSHWQIAEPADLKAQVEFSPIELNRLAEFIRTHALPRSLTQPALCSETPLATLALLSKLQTTAPAIADLQAQFFWLQMDEGRAFVTGYYTPEFEASTQPIAPYRHPIYMPPSDIASHPHRYERRDIDTHGMLKGKNLELAYLKSRLDAYFVQVQGSAMLKMANGSHLRINTAATNDLPYVSIGKLLVRDGRIRQQDVSLQAIRAYFAQHPEQLESYLLQNRRYVFFSSSKTPPLGSMGAPVITMNSLASERRADGTYQYPPFMPMVLSFADDKNPTGRKHVLAWNLDTGSAIKGSGRFDLYTGMGEAGEARAGTLRHDATYHLLWPKNVPLPKTIADVKVRQPQP